jgi:NAD(P)-dependent dehydrogenase (short-subunit alcohol dehydrogenase family)
MTDLPRPSSVLVTGAASGVGQHAATRYAANTTLWRARRLAPGP